MLKKKTTYLSAPITTIYKTTKGSLTFCEERKNVSATNSVLIAYDIWSLFTSSIPLKERIGIAVNLLFEHNTFYTFTK